MGHILIAPSLALLCAYAHLLFVLNDKSQECTITKTGSCWVGLYWDFINLNKENRLCDGVDVVCAPETLFVSSVCFLVAGFLAIFGFSLVVLESNLCCLLVSSVLVLAFSLIGLWLRLLCAPKVCLAVPTSTFLVWWLTGSARTANEFDVEFGCAFRISCDFLREEAGR